MFSKSRIARLFSLALLLSSVSVSAFAAPFDSEFARANELYAQRTQTNTAPVTQAIQILDLILGQAQDSETRYEALWMKSKFQYFLGSVLEDNDVNRPTKLRAHETGKAAAEAAIALRPYVENGTNNRAEAYYYLGINWGRYLEAVDPARTESFKFRDDLRKVAQTVNSIDQSFDARGANRTLAWIDYRIATASSSLVRRYGSIDRAITLMQSNYLAMIREQANNANTNDKSYRFGSGLNYLYYAIPLIVKGDQTRDNDKIAAGKKVMEELISFRNNPAGLNPVKAAESTMEIRTAQEAYVAKFGADAYRAAFNNETPPTVSEAARGLWPR